MTTAIDLPLDAQERLLDFAEQLPESKRAQFVKNVAHRVGDLAKDHPRTIIFAALGWVLGEIIDNLLTIKIPFSEIVVCLTADRASEIMGAGAGIAGFIRDRKAKAEREAVARVVGEELRQALR
jgi:hypothetical protein